jgi:hypothetical protein
MRRVLGALVFLCACGQGGSTGGTDPVVAGNRRIQPASVVSFLGPTFDSGPIAQVWISDQSGYCAQVATMDPCHANFAAGEGPPAGTYLHLSARGTLPGTYSIPTAGSAQLDVVTGVFSLTILDGTSGSVTFSTLDVERASGSYDVTFGDGTRATGRFDGTGCAAFEPLYAKMRLPQYRVGFTDSVAGPSCSATATCNSRARSVSCTAAGGTSWSCDCTREDGSHTSCSVNAPSGNGCNAVPDSCCVVGF